MAFAYFAGDFLKTAFLEPSAASFVVVLALLRWGVDSGSSRFAATGAVSAVPAVLGRSSSSSDSRPPS